jgi:hypothetical protein
MQSNCISRSRGLTVWFLVISVRCDPANAEETSRTPLFGERAPCVILRLPHFGRFCFGALTYSGIFIVFRM